MHTFNTVKVQYTKGLIYQYHKTLTCMHTFNTVKVRYTKDLIYQYHHNLFVSFCDQFCMSSQHNIYSVISLEILEVGSLFSTPNNIFCMYDVIYFVVKCILMLFSLNVVEVESGR